jgi:hypothetical protein
MAFSAFFFPLFEKPEWTDAPVPRFCIGTVVARHDTERERTRSGTEIPLTSRTPMLVQCWFDDDDEQRARPASAGK